MLNLAHGLIRVYTSYNKHSELIILIDSMWEERRGCPRAAPALTDRSPRAARTAAPANPPI